MSKVPDFPISVLDESKKIFGFSILRGVIGLMVESGKHVMLFGRKRPFFFLRYCRMHFVYFLVLCFTVVLPTSVFSQDFPYNFQTWGIRNGLSSDFCNAISSDSNGYIYAGTNNGIYSFNGTTFKPLVYDGRDKITGEGNVTDLVTDRFNRIWFASAEYGLGLISVGKNIRVQYFQPDIDSLIYGEQPEVPRLAKLCFDANGDLWVGSLGLGLYKFDTTSKKFQHVPVKNPWSLYNNYIRSLVLHGQDSLLIGTINGMSVLKVSTGNISFLKFNYSGKQISPTIRRATSWNEDTLILATDRGTYLLQPSTGKLIDIRSDQIDFSKIDGNDIFRLNEDEWWIATESDGVLFFRVANGKVYHSWQLSVFDKGIPKGFVSRFYKDAKGKLWIAHQNGISLFQTAELRFNSYSFFESDMYSGHMLTQNDKLLFVKGNRITQLDPNSNVVTSRDISGMLKRNTVPNCVIEDGDNYVVFIKDSVFFINKASFDVKALALGKQGMEPGMFGHFMVMKCIPDTLYGRKQYVLWAFSSIGAVLLTCDPTTGKLDYFLKTYFTNPFEHNYSNLIKESSGKYWIGTRNNGIFFVDVNSSGNNRRLSAGTNKCLPSNHVNDILLDEEGNLWVLVFLNGLIRLNTAEPENDYSVYGVEQGLTDNRVYRFIRDSNKNFWITSNAGLFCFDFKDNYFLRYSAFNGLGNVRFHINEIYLVKTSNDYIAISDRYNELLWFKALLPQPSSALLVLRNMVVNDKPIVSKEGEPLSFQPEENSFSFEFDVIDYEKTREFKIWYKLENYDAEWQNGELQNTFRYRQLTGGDYTFRTKLGYLNDTFSEEQIINFSIKTIWYKTWWFIFLAGVVAIGIGYLLVRSYLKRKLYLQKKELELKNAVALERARISTELHDDLGSGLSTIRILSQSLHEGTNGNLSKGSNLEKISSHSHELIKKMREIVWALNHENDTLDQLISYIRLQSATLLDSAAIEYKYDVPDFIPEIKVTGGNRRHIQLLAKEAVHNIIKHSEATEVLFVVAIAEELTISIQDNGKGIPEEGIVKAAGNGLKNMQKHAEGIRGRVIIENVIGVKMTLNVPISGLSHESVI